MKVLFLDIDGVLNSLSSSIAFDGYPHDFSQKGMAKFDMVAVGLVRKLCEECDVSIVLSSTWRMYSPVSDAASALNLPIFDKTPVLNGIRGLEIKDWLDKHPEVTHYAILDDDSDMLSEQKEFFVKTSFKDGMSIKNYSQLKRIFGYADSSLEKAVYFDKQGE